VEAGAGSQGRPVLVVQRVGAVVVAGEAAGEPEGNTARGNDFGKRQR
jgi:hypothetical protein